MLPSRKDNWLLEAGCDEAGRGCLAGPVFAAAVILPDDAQHPELNDSKQLSKNTRLVLRDWIEENAIAFAVSFCRPSTIDKINILNASFEAMHLALRKMKPRPEKLLVDGNRFKPFKRIPYECIIKGDGKIGSIAAASILAKTYRDEYMERKHHEFPQYGWETNKGYPTAQHRQAIIEYGPCPLHRKSFQLYPLPVQLELF
ncbi:MAG: ribonuclease HII [Saprospiraceae bacterium]|nr:ribonuclease HII [Saprospiraceae bacterium]